MEPIKAVRILLGLAIKRARSAFGILPFPPRRPHTKITHPPSRLVEINLSRLINRAQMFRPFFEKNLVRRSSGDYYLTVPSLVPPPKVGQIDTKKEWDERIYVIPGTDVIFEWPRPERGKKERDVMSRCSTRKYTPSGPPLTINSCFFLLSSGTNCTNPDSIRNSPSHIVFVPEVWHPKPAETTPPASKSHIHSECQSIRRTALLLFSSIPFDLLLPSDHADSSADIRVQHPSFCRLQQLRRSTAPRTGLLSALCFLFLITCQTTRLVSKVSIPKTLPLSVVKNKVKLNFFLLLEFQNQKEILAHEDEWFMWRGIAAWPPIWHQSELRLLDGGERRSTRKGSTA